MVNTYRKGYRREKEAMAVFEKMGFVCHRAKITRFNSNDFFGCFDFCAVKQGYPNYWVQVKSNRITKQDTEKIEEFAKKHFDNRVNIALIVVKKDRKLWTIRRFNVVPVVNQTTLAPQITNAITPGMIESAFSLPAVS